MVYGNIHGYKKHMVNRDILCDVTPEPAFTLVLAREIVVLSWDIANMEAPFWRVYLPESDGGMITWAGQNYPLRVGELMVIAPYTQCQASLARPFRKFFAHVEWQPAVTAAVTPIVAVYPCPHGWLADIQQAVADHRDQDVHLYLSALCRWGCARTAAIEQRGPHLSARMQEICAYMRAQVADPPSNSGLASRLELHVGSFVRAFRQEVGMTPQQYGLRLRLDEAARLLATTAMDVDAIAEACGFYDRNHLTKAFTRRWQCPPAAYRTQNAG